MPPLTDKEALELANKFSETGANIILLYQTGPWDSEQKNELRKTAHGLIYQSEEMITGAVDLILENAQTSLTDLKEVTGEVQATISRLQNIKRIIDICTATLTLATAIASKDIGGIMNSILKLKSLLFTELKVEVSALRGVAALAAIPSATPTAKSMKAMAGTHIVAFLNTLDLTGKWSCDDGGTYYLRQIGNNVYWYGERDADNPAWTNVFVGQMQADQVSGNWADVPKGQVMQYGEMSFKISSNWNSFDCVHKTGNFGGSHWSRAGVSECTAPGTQGIDCTGYGPNCRQAGPGHGEVCTGFGPDCGSHRPDCPSTHPPHQP
jgi:hypothetical protein